MKIANAKINLYNWAIIGIMAITFIVFSKVILNKWKLPGATDLVNMA